MVSVHLVFVEMCIVSILFAVQFIFDWKRLAQKIGLSFGSGLWQLGIRSSFAHMLATALALHFVKRSTFNRAKRPSTLVALHFQNGKLFHSQNSTIPWGN